MGEAEPPLLADVYPKLVAYLASALVAEGEEALAQAAGHLRFFGWCTCSPTCKYIKTAPSGSADSLWIHLEDEDTPYVWLQLAQSHTTFAGMEICDFEL